MEAKLSSRKKLSKEVTIHLIVITNTLYEKILIGKSTSAACEIKLLHFANIDSQNAHCKY